MPATDWGWQITPEELTSWIIDDSPSLLVINKPPFVVCHPSKHGPWSSLIGACREYLGVSTLHMPARLDRETSGVVLFAKDRATASRLQSAVQQRQVEKTYYAILTGELREVCTVRQPIARDEGAAFACRQWILPSGQTAETEFIPLARNGAYTLTRVQPRTGRLHQIRVHASWLGHAIAGDKLYGPDPALMLEFLENGFSPYLQARLPLPRHALHCATMVFTTEQGREEFHAPLTPDLARFCQEQFGVLPGQE